MQQFMCASPVGLTRYRSDFTALDRRLRLADVPRTYFSIECRSIQACIRYHFQGKLPKRLTKEIINTFSPSGQSRIITSLVYSPPLVTSKLPSFSPITFRMLLMAYLFTGLGYSSFQFPQRPTKSAPHYIQNAYTKPARPCDSGHWHLCRSFQRV